MAKRGQTYEAKSFTFASHLHGARLRPPVSPPGTAIRGESLALEATPYLLSLGFSMPWQVFLVAPSADIFFRSLVRH